MQAQIRSQVSLSAVSHTYTSLHVMGFLEGHWKCHVGTQFTAVFKRSPECRYWPTKHFDFDHDTQLQTRARAEAAHTHEASSQCSTTVLLDAGCAAGLIDTSREFMSKACGAQSGTPMPIPALCAPRSRQCAADMTPYISHATVENLELHSDKSEWQRSSQSRTHSCGPTLAVPRFRTSSVKSSTALDHRDFATRSSAAAAKV